MKGWRTTERAAYSKGQQVKVEGMRPAGWRKSSGLLQAECALRMVGVVLREEPSFGQGVRFPGARAALDTGAAVRRSVPVLKGRGSLSAQLCSFSEFRRAWAEVKLSTAVSCSVLRRRSGSQIGLSLRFGSSRTVTSLLSGVFSVACSCSNARVCRNAR